MPDPSRTTADDRLAARRATARTVAGLLIVLAIAPVLFDATRLCLARWAALSGPVPVVRTPTLDFVGAIVEESVGALGRPALRPFRHCPWRTDWVIGGMIAIMAGCIALLQNMRR